MCAGQLCGFNLDDEDPAMSTFQAKSRFMAAAEAHEAAAEAHRVAVRLLAAGNLLAAIDQMHEADRCSAQASEASAMAVFCLTSDASGNVRTSRPIGALLTEAEAAPA
jgi:hypothetical protein